MATPVESNGGASKASDFGPNVHISSHPVLSHKVTILRSSSTLPSTFRAILREVTYHLGYEATATLKSRPVDISVPLGNNHIDYTGTHINEKVALIPILRSGLGLVDAMLELLPNAGIHHIGMYHSPIHVPVQYYNRLPKQCEYDVAYVLDAVIATASTVMSLIGILKKWGVPKIHIIAVIASREGLAKITETHPDVSVTVGTVDDVLDEEGRVIPGLGDSGDRQYKTPLIENDEALLHPSKRKRSDA